MESKKENLKALFTNSRTRLVIMFTFAILLIGVAIAIFRFSLLSQPPAVGLASVSEAPGGIQSIPGKIGQTAQYAKLQEQQNLYQAKSAMKTGGSAIPTIIETQAFGEGVESIKSPGSVGFVALSQKGDQGERGVWYDVLKNGSCSKSSLDKVLSLGAGLADLRQACSCKQLNGLGYSLKDLKSVCACPELRDAGFKAAELKAAGFDAKRLKDCGYSACDLHAAGFSAQALKEAGFSDGELRGAGYSDTEIANATGLPNGVTADEVRKAGCSAEALTKLRKKGVSASAIRRISGCSAAQLKAAGYSAKELRDAGFTAAELAKAGFSAAELKAAGFSPRDLLNAGFSPKDLLEAGFTAEQVKEAGGEFPPGITASDLKKAGCSIDALKQERLAGVSAELIRKHAGCSAAMLKAAGFTDEELAAAGFTPEEIKAANEEAAGLMSDQAIKDAGCDKDKLSVLISKGVSVEKIRSLNGCTAEQLKAAGATAKDLLAAGFTPEQLLAAGFTPDDLKAAGVNPADILAAGRVSDCSASSLQAAFKAGISAKTIRETLGCSAAALKAAGYSAKDLKDAGFTAAELKAAGFSAKDLKDAGFSPKDLKDAGFSAKELKDAGFSAADLKDAGFSAKDLKDAGFSAKDLKDAGYADEDIAAAGYSPEELKAAGVNLAVTSAVGSVKDCSATTLQAAFKAGVSAKAIKEKLGCSAAALKAAGYSAKDLKDAGFSAAELKAAGFSAKDLLEAGFSPTALKDAGFPNDEIAVAAAALAASGMSVAGLDDNKIIVQPLSSSFSQKDLLEKVAANNRAQQLQLQQAADKQKAEMAAQRHQQEIQERTSAMVGAANAALQVWKAVPIQAYTGGGAGDEAEGKKGLASLVPGATTTVVQEEKTEGGKGAIILRTGDIVFAVLDTTVNTDEPSPILATIVSGTLKGSKLIGSFTLPPNANKMIIMFNTLSIPGAPKTNSISAFAIDPETARTALSGRVDHHYLSRYGSMFAASFIEGFGNAFQSANTTVTIGGTGGGDNITVQNGIGRSTLENAVIGLATVGKSWGQVAQQNMNRPTTVELFAGTGLGILFTQDVSISKQTI